MTITNASSAPLVAVVDATGQQGGSVIQALAASDQPYRVRGFTRNATNPVARALAKIGVEVVTIWLVVENREQVCEVFSGADAAFVSVFFLFLGIAGRRATDGAG